jgi:acyl carrier protein
MMTGVTVEQVRHAIANHLTEEAAGTRTFQATELADERDLLEDGLIDSLGLLRLLGALQEQFGDEIDFEDLDPERMTVVGPICEYVVNQAE